MVELASQQTDSASDYPRALKMLDHALCAKRWPQPPAPPAELALIFYVQGRVLWRMRRLEEALVQQQEALHVRERFFGSEHPDVAMFENRENVGEEG